MALDPSVVAARFLYGRLAGDAALVALLGGQPRIHEAIIPPETALPAVVFQQQGGSDLNGVAGTRVWGELVYVVKAVGEGESVTAVSDIADRVDALLHQAPLTAVAGGRVYSCTREGGVRYPEAEAGGKRFQHLGGRYRLYAQAP